MNNEVAIAELLSGSVLSVRTENSVYQLTKLPGKNSVRIKVIEAKDEQPDYMVEGFETEFSGMSNGRHSILDGVLKVCDKRMNMGMAFEGHPSTGHTHRLTTCVLEISDVSHPGIDGLKLGSQRPYRRGYS
jgi:hypothetical protein